MGAMTVPVALADRLGETASEGLLDMFEAHRRAVAEFAVVQCGERFERRLVEETSKLHVEMAGLRSDLREIRSDLREEMATNRFELLKWSFVFWVGQFVSVVAVVGIMLRMK